MREIFRAQRIYRAKTSFGEWLQSKFTSRSSVSNRVYTSPNGPAGVTLRGALLFRGFEPYGRFLRLSWCDSLKILAVSFPAGWPTQAFLSGAHHDTPDVSLGERVDILGRRLSISDTLKRVRFSVGPRLKSFFLSVGLA